MPSDASSESVQPENDAADATDASPTSSDQLNLPTIPTASDGHHSAASADRTPETRLQEFLDPIHGFVSYSSREIKIIDHPAFQRLFNMHQLGQTNLVFRGATHCRGEHALGAVAVAEQLISAIDNAFVRESESLAQTQSMGDQDLDPVDHEWAVGERLSPLEATFFRLAVLLHDIGHVVAGHTLEDELGLLHKHDDLKRIVKILDKTVWGDLDITTLTDGSNESLRDTIDRLYESDAAEAAVLKIERHKFNSQHTVKTGPLDPTAILLEIIAHDSINKPNDDPDIEIVYESESRSQQFRLAILQDLVGNTVCADLLDYLHRDWQHIGKPRPPDARLLQYVEVRTNARTKRSHVVVNLRSDQEHGYRPDAISSILELLENRYHLWEVALLHRTKTAAAAMLERAIAEKLDDSGLLSQDPSNITSDLEELEDKLLDTILETSDAEIYDVLRSADWRRKKGRRSRKKTDSIDPLDLFWRLRYRVLHKEVSRVQSSRGREISDELAPRKGSQQARIEAGKSRLSSMRALERDFELASGSLVMHVVPYGLGKKLAEVRVLYDDRVVPLDQLDDEQDERISGGHLQAQLKRFNQLWRASLFVAPEVRDELKSRKLLEPLDMAFRLAVLNLHSEPHDLRHRRYSLRQLAVELARGGSLEYAQEDLLLPSEEVAARGDGEGGAYSSRHPTLREHFKTPRDKNPGA